MGTSLYWKVLRHPHDVAHMASTKTLACPRRTSSKRSTRSPVSQVTAQGQEQNVRDGLDPLGDPRSATLFAHLHSASRTRHPSAAR